MELNSFVIIEYKKKQSEGLLAQGLAYLSKINERKAEIVIEYNRKTKNQKQVKDFDWSQIRVIFVAPKFDKNQVQAVKLDYHIELWELTIFDGGLWNFVLLNPLNKPINASKQNNKTVKLPLGIKPTYTEEYHFDNFSSSVTKSLYTKYKQQIMEFDPNIVIVSRQKHIAFKIDGTSFVSLSLKKSSINFDFYLTVKELDDPKNLLQNMTNIGSWTGCKSRIIASDEETAILCKNYQTML